MRSAWASAWFSRTFLALALSAASGLGLPGPARAEVFLSQSQALELAFPDAERVERRSFVLTEAQAESVERLARAPLGSRIVTLHVGWKGKAVLGYAVIDVHTVRTMFEALMVVLTPEGAVRSLRMLAFHEPPDYLPTRRWFGQFEGKALGPDLQLKRGIHAIAGATLSARAVTRSVRRTLALYQVLIRGKD